MTYSKIYFAVAKDIEDMDVGELEMECAAAESYFMGCDAMGQGVGIGYHNRAEAAEKALRAHDKGKGK